MALVRGALGLFSLVDLLQLLASNQSKGCLVIMHPVKGEARAFFEAGKVTHIAFDDREDSEALQLLLRDERGNFEFLPGRVAPKVSIKVSFDNLLFSAIRNLGPAERPEDKEIPPPDELDIPTVKDLGRISQLTLSTDEFSVIEKIDGKKSVHNLVQQTNLPFENVQRILMRLASLNMIDVKKREARVARLVVQLNRQIDGLTVYLDEVIMRTWVRQNKGQAITQVRLRQDSGRELVVNATSAPDLGAYLLLSDGAMVRFGLNSGMTVLVKPEVK
jgi:hypothetical protein